MAKCLKNIGVLCALLFFSACSVPTDRVRFDLAGDATIFVNNKVQRGEIVVSVHPNVNLEAPPTALLMPFGLTQPMNDATRVSLGVSRIIWQQLLASGAFSVLEMPDMRPPYTVETALNFARAKGAQFLVGGYITYYLDGGTVGDTRISLQMEVYDVLTGNLLWSMAHAGVLPYETTRDFLLVEVKTRMPYDPVAAVITALTADMGKLLSMWTDPNNPAFKGKNTPSRPSAFGKI